MVTVRTRKHIVLLTIVITLIAVGTTALFVHLVTAHLLPERAYWFAMMLAAGLPMVIAPPISIVALGLLRAMTLGMDKIENFVKFDALTGVLARNYFMECVRQRFSEGGAFMLVDADHFKRVNDTFGHDVGDETLRTIGRVLDVAVPPAALVGRIGGEEFGLFLPSMSEAQAVAVAETICRTMRAEGKTIADKPVGLTVSIGVALVARGASLTLIYKQADERLYSAKSNGRDRYVFSSEAAGTPVTFRPTG